MTRRPTIPPVQRHKDEKNDYQRKPKHPSWPFPVSIPNHAPKDRAFKPTYPEDLPDGRF